MANYYDVLGVEPSVTQDELRRAYQRRVQLLHPDRHAGSSQEVIAEAGRSLRELNEAWSVLRDPQQRRQYDASLRSTSPRISAQPHPNSLGQRLMWIGLAIIGAALLIDSVWRGLLVAVLGVIFFGAGVAGSRRRAK